MILSTNWLADYVQVVAPVELRQYCESPPRDAPAGGNALPGSVATRPELPTIYSMGTGSAGSCW